MQRLVYLMKVELSGESQEEGKRHPRDIEWDEKPDPGNLMPDLLLTGHQLVGRRVKEYPINLRCKHSIVLRLPCV